MGQKNYISLTRFPLRFRHYAYFDVPDNLADSLFYRHKVRVCFGDEYGKNGTEYKIIFCKIRKKDEDKFLAALGELSNKMILFGHQDYDDFCKEAMTMFEKEKEDGQKNKKKNNNSNFPHE